MGTILPRAVARDGIYTTDSGGRRYIDGSGGAAVSCLGHNHPEVLEAMKGKRAAEAVQRRYFRGIRASISCLASHWQCDQRSG